MLGSMMDMSLTTAVIVGLVLLVVLVIAAYVAFRVFAGRAHAEDSNPVRTRPLRRGSRRPGRR